MTTGREICESGVQYAAPKLRVYGSMVELTAGGSGTRVETVFVRRDRCSLTPNNRDCPLL